MYYALKFKLLLFINFFLKICMIKKRKMNHFYNLKFNKPRFIIENLKSIKHITLNGKVVFNI